MSADADKYVTYTFMWHALFDACPQCRNLDGRTWEDQNIWQDTLWDPIWGDIWDLNINMPLTHGGTGAHCRCQLEVQAHFDWDKLRETNQLNQVLNTQLQTPPDTVINENEPGEETDFSTVPEMRQEISGLTQQVNTLEESSGKASLSLRQEIHTLNEIMLATEILTGDKNLSAIVTKVHQFIMVLLRARMLLFAIQEAEAGVLGPLGWLYAGANAIGFGVAMSNLGQ